MNEYFENCNFCGCPRAVHPDSKECLHCKAFPSRGVNCKHFKLLREEYYLITMHRDFFFAYVFLFWFLGICFGSALVITLQQPVLGVGGIFLCVSFLAMLGGVLLFYRQKTLE